MLFFLHITSSKILSNDRFWSVFFLRCVGTIQSLQWKWATCPRQYNVSQPRASSHEGVLCRLARHLLRYEVEFFAVDKSFLPTQSVQRTLSNSNNCWYFQALNAAWSCFLLLSVLYLVDHYTGQCLPLTLRHSYVYTSQNHGYVMQ